MRKISAFVCATLLAFLSLAFIPADDDLSIKNKAKAELAKQKLYGGEYKSALVMFNEILIDHPGNGVMLYYAAECHLKLGERDKARERLEKAKQSSKVSPEAFLLLGQLYHEDGKLDEALSEFSAFKARAGEAEQKESSVDLYMSQCNTAKTLLAKPVDVKVENLGQHINSKYDDKSPSLTLDGKKIYFNSRRPAGTDDPVDTEGDGRYFEHIYSAAWDSVKGAWGEAREVAGAINERGAHSACTGISQDGKQIFIYKNNMQDNKSRGGDIFISKVMNNKWKKPEPVGKPVNTTYFESGACISPDGKTLYFVSESPKYGKEKGFGGADIWMVQRVSKKEWGKPVNLGPEINTPYQEGGIFLAADGKTLFFCSNNPNSMGDLDLFRTVYENGKWSKPENLGYPINTVRRDGPMCLSVNGKTAFFSSARPGGLGENDIYAIDLKDYALLEKGFTRRSGNELSIIGGIVRDGYEGTPVEGAEVIFTDESGKQVASLTTNEGGEYVMTLKGNVIYTVQVTKKGYKPTEEKVTLPMGQGGETYRLEKQFLLNK